ncbi:MAG: family 10 glycosylhydrolase [Prevotella sp.]|jgi:uncharacterized lipoprotein YddW (UPF0748 family)|nr:family 10 glycosylhydrolase [Prevotella sp.]
MLKRLTHFVFIACIFISCGSQKNEIVDTGKPKYLWFDSEANFERFASKDSIKYYLDKAKAAGFNQIVVDVRPTQGDVLYKSDFMPLLTEHKGYKVERDWDYLQFFIDEAKKRKLKVTVSTTIFPIGKPHTRNGAAYRDGRWDGKTAVEYTKSKAMIDVKDDKSKVAAFLNPVLPEAQDYAMKFVEELLTKYDFDSYALDYCRYAGDESDFSEASHIAFEKYIGEKVENFPADIFTWNDDGSKTPGKFYKQWWEFRSMVIHDFVKKVKEKIKEVKPDVKLEYWAASWIGYLYNQGQNWASKSYDFSSDGYDEWASLNYKNTGFAEHLDVFLCGTYLERIFGMDDNESIEYGLARANRIINGDCAMYGTIYALNHEKNIEDAVYVCLTQSEGLMVFDIVQVIGFNLWDDIKKGIDRAENADKNK